MRAISRFAIASRAVFSSAPVAAWNRRLKSSCRASRSRCPSSSPVRSRRSLAFKETRLPRHELRLDRQLLRGEAERLLRERLRNAGELEHHLAGLDDRDPPLGRALAGAHARLGRLLREALVREHVDPDLAATLDLARHRDTSRLDLAIGDPAGVEGLEPVVAELDGRLAAGVAGPAAAVHLAELGLLRHEHQLSPSFFVFRGARFGFSCEGSPDCSSLVGSSTCCFGVVVSGALATSCGVTSTSGSITGCSRPSAETPCSSVRGCSVCLSRRGRPAPAPPEGRAPDADCPRRCPGRPCPPPGPRRRCRTGPRPSRSGPRPRPLSREAPSPSSAPPRRLRVSWSPSRASLSPKPSGMISPLLIQTLTPIRPAVVFASTKP